MANKLPIVNYSGKQKEIASGDKVPYDYIEGNDSVIEIPFTAFSDIDNPTLSEVQTWADSNLTSEQLYNSTIVYVRDIILKPEEYSFPTSSRTLTISGSDQASLDSITINSTLYNTGLPLYLQDSSGLPLNDTNLHTLQNTIVSIFASAGFTVECLVNYSSTSSCFIKIWQTVYNSGSPTATWLCTYTNNSSTVSTASTTNTASVSSAQIVYSSSQEDPMAIYKVINSIVYEVNKKERVSFYDISVRNLPTHDPLLHPYGLIATVDKTGLKYQSTKEGWVLLTNNRFSDSIIEGDIKLSNAIVYADDPAYVKILPLSNIANLTNYLHSYVRILKMETSISMEIVDSSVTPYVSINGKLEVTNSNWIQSTDETTRTTFRNVASNSLNTPLYVRLTKLDASSGAATISATTFIHSGVYLQTGSILFSSTKSESIQGSASLRLEELSNNKENTHLPSYRDTDLGTLTLGTDDTGKTIWNTTQSEVQVWDGTAWNALGTGGGGGANLTFTGSSSPYTLASDSGTDVTFSAGSNITLTRTGNDLQISATGGGATNLTFSGSGPFTLESDTGTDVTITEGTNIDIVRTGNDLTINAAGTDLSVSGGSSVITLGSSTGNDVTLTAGVNITLTQSGSDVTIAATSSGGGVSLGLVNAIRLGIFT